MLVEDFYSASAVPESYKIIGSIERDMCVCVCVYIHIYNIYIYLFIYICMYACMCLVINLFKILQTIMHKPWHQVNIARN